jgi:hypothetical protein
METRRNLQREAVVRRGGIRASLAVGYRSMTHYTIAATQPTHTELSKSITTSAYPTRRVYTSDEVDNIVANLDKCNRQEIVCLVAGI